MWKVNSGTGEVTQWLRISDVLAEDKSSTPSNHVGDSNTWSSSSEVSDTLTLVWAHTNTHCLMQCAVKTHSYKRKHLIRAILQLQRFSPLSSWQGAWWYTGRHGAGEQLRVLYLDLQTAGIETLDLAWAFETSKATHDDIFSPMKTYLLQQGYTSWSLQIAPHSNDQASKYMSLPGWFLFKTPHKV